MGEQHTLHVGGLKINNIMVLGQERVKWEEWKSSTSMFEPPWEKKDGTIFREVWVE
jgi:hypothetical protein